MSFRSRILAGGLTLLVMCAPACSKSDDEAVMDPVVLAMVETTPPIFDDGESQIFQVTKDVRLPFRRFTDAERPKGNAPPYNRPPFHLASASRTTLRFTLTNLDAKKHNVEMLIDPWNEFVRYEPGLTIVENEPAEPNFSGIQRTYVLEPRSRIEGIITPDDMVELATDLTTAMALDRSPPDAMGQFGGPVLFNRAFNVQNRSSEPDIVLAPYLPANRAGVAAVTGFTLGLRSEEAFRVSVEIVADVQDKSEEGDRLLIAEDDGEEVDKDPKKRQLGRPGEVLSPPAAAAP
ncbi:MAG: hypothetical protein U0270_01260 [Labilithrix sp.]